MSATARRLIWYAIVAFIIWWVIEQPEQAAAAAHRLSAVLQHASISFGKFVSSI